MREIKFRAWDGERMYNWDELIEKQPYSSFFRNLDGWILLQFTDLLSNNGVEIYELDYLEAEGVKALIHYSVNHACWLWGSEKFSNAIARLGVVKGSIYENPELVK